MRPALLASVTCTPSPCATRTPCPASSKVPVVRAVVVPLRDRNRGVISTGIEDVAIPTLHHAVYKDFGTSAAKAGHRPAGGPDATHRARPRQRRHPNPLKYADVPGHRPMSGDGSPEDAQRFLVPGSVCVGDVFVATEP